MPQHDDRALFEMLVLEGTQAGLSWITILKKREHYRRAFARFDPVKVAHYSARKVKHLLANTAIIRNRLKIEAAIHNARAFMTVQDDVGSFDAYIWQFVDGSPKQNAWQTLKEVPSQTQKSNAMSLDLKRRGFRFVGPTVCYAFMQATGMVNDHLVNCFRYHAVREGKR